MAISIFGIHNRREKRFLDNLIPEPDHIQKRDDTLELFFDNGVSNGALINICDFVKRHSTNEDPVGMEIMF